MDGWGLSNVKYVDAEPEATGDGAHSFPGRKPGKAGMGADRRRSTAPCGNLKTAFTDGRRALFV